LNFNAGDYDKRTPLHLACAAGHYDVVKYLIDTGVEINVADRWGATPLNDAKETKIIDYLVSKGAKKGVEQPQFSEISEVTVTDD